MTDVLTGKTILLGVTGGIAAYKSAEIVRLLVRAGARVDVVMTRSAREFITPLTMQTLSQRPVLTDMFSLIEESEIGHIAVARRADIAVIAPATANVIAKMAAGLADDPLTTVLLATSAPILVCPAMNDRMWAHPATQANIQTLAARGVEFVDPRAGDLACRTEGIGRLAEPADIVAAIERRLAGGPLSGMAVVVTAGPTHEPIDAARMITNRSSGKMGYALAEAARDMGAAVTLVSGPTALADPPGVATVRVRTAAEMMTATREAFAAANALIMCAAVADVRPANPAAGKIAKAELGDAIALAPNDDIVATLAREKGDRLVVGFAAEAGKGAAGRARKKLADKGLDFIVVNDVGDAAIGFDSGQNEVMILGRDGDDRSIARAPKRDVARQILEHVFKTRLLGTPGGA
ncbi:bifunctional phosphopantothenoylcysteine decarboxylase/phosphopantothenate--cysteine ligase CoaBC [bacterium]|nr:bifunctional phosphopantothenoylcysteine decarboxylase/phosphopantothenate--cysteine ligase CoaBC [bacterium]